MKRIHFLKGLALSLAFSAFSLSAIAQASPAATATGTVNGANITIKYNAPAVKGRQIWGALVPYDKVWRAGANAATVFETDKDITVEGQKLPAGKYSVYMTPGEKEWTVFFNSQTGQWGITRQGETTKDASKDVVTVKVKSQKSAQMNESLVYRISNKGFSLSWENLEVPVMIK
jgi:hypothetical protein